MLDKAVPHDTLAELGKQAGLSKGTYHKAQVIIAKASDEVKQALRTGETSINAEYNKLTGKVIESEQENARNHRALGTGENEWYTPSEYAELARSVMGSIDLDPASCDEANKTIKAKVYFTKETDGLSKPWVGNIWCNPPYSRDLMPSFVEKLKQSFQNGSVSQAILVSHNNTDTAWFQSLATVASAICFPNKRIKFYRGEEVAAPTNGQAFFYLGTQTEAFASAFGEVGFTVKPL